MPMHATTVRFSDDLWELLEREAGEQGVSTAQFVRDAALMRVASVVAKRGELDGDEALARLAREAAGRRASSASEVRNPHRLRAVRSSGLLDSPREESLDRLTRVAAAALQAPVALISIVDERRQFLKSCVGVAEPWASTREMALSHSYCQHATTSREPLVVPDVREHPLLRDSLAIADLGAIAYAGIPLELGDGQVLGTLCVIDHRPREWTADEVALLRELAAAVVEQINRDGRGRSAAGVPNQQ